MLVATFSVALLALILLLTAPAGAQTDGTDLAGETARFTDSADTDPTVDRIVVTVADCEANNNASVVVRDDDGTRARLTDGGNVTIATNGNAITIAGTDDGGNLDGVSTSGGDGQFGTEGETVDGEVVSSAGITCGDDGRQRADDDDAADDDADGARADDDNLENLSCDELLVLFRGEGEEQYGVADRLADSDVRARIEVCLEREIVNNPGGDLPNTGGLSLIGVAVLGAAAAVVGLAVSRGGRR